MTILKRDVKQLTLNLFRHVHYPNFLSSRSDLTQLHSWSLFSLWRQCQKVKGPRRRVWILRLRSRPLLMQVSRVLFCIEIIGAVVLFKRKKSEKDICRAHMFRSLDCKFSFCTNFWHRWNRKKINKAHSM